ncbi:hypothetical protein CYMTET_31689 [Cymbomonas tetramitiformis]|uniref:TRP C-terminal domain-containing protein n=1 Tax=Cymbomonas tetramitiformis TaxID=36881 RepID=A0AAE0KSQ2_9CHLO|nr:hypothetical protein CYMTET_31689 [Cymbomonas tetramitiformis]
MQVEVQLPKDEGGGIYISHRYVNGDEPVVVMIITTLISSNKAERYSGGGLTCSGHGAVHFSNSTVEGNWALKDGAGINMYMSALVVDAGCNVTGNVAGASGGGINLDEQSSLVLTGSSLTYNQAELGGGLALGNNSTAVIGAGQQGHATGSNHTCRLEECGCTDGPYDVHLIGNTALSGNAVVLHRSVISMINVQVALQEERVSSHTSILLAPPATIGLLEAVLQVTETLFCGNRGSALSVGPGSVLLLSDSTLSNNKAMDGAGGALYSTTISTVQAVNCMFQGNSGRLGGAMYLAGQAFIEGSTFLWNHADDGGAAYVLLYNDTVSTIANSSFQNSSAAGIGAVLYLRESESHPDAEKPTLAGLNYTGNTAVGAAAVLFWHPVQQNGSLAPSCAGCVVSGNTAAYSTGEGLATAAAALAAVALGEQTGGEKIRENLRVTVVDMYGLVVVTDNTTSINAAMSASSPANCSLSGAVRTQVIAGLALFDDMVLSGSPGSVCLVEFNAQMDDALFHVAVKVALRTCVMGEELLGTAMCSECKEGYLGFGNMSCSSCGDTEGLVCPGGATFQVEDGYWVAPNAAYCAEDVECFLDRVYQCEVAAACTTAEDGDALDRRTGAGAASVGNLSLCNEKSYQGGVLCGGAEVSVCSYDHYVSPTQARCIPCQAIHWILINIMVMVLLAGAVIYFVYFLFSRGSSQQLAGQANSPLPRQATGSRDDWDKGIEMGDNLNKIRSILSLILGYFQVLGSLPTVFGGAVPSLLLSFTSVIRTVSNFTVIDFKCLIYYLTANQRNNGFFKYTFYQSVAMPWVLVLVSYAVYCMLLVRQGQGVFQAAAGASRKIPAGVTAEAALALVADTVDAEIAEQHRERARAKMKDLRNSARSSCLGMLFFLLTLMHPQVSITMCLWFRCLRVHNESQDMIQTSWLIADTSIQCFRTTSWVIGAVCAIVTLVVYTFGFPLMLYFVMSGLRTYRQVHINLQLVPAEALCQNLKTRRWILRRAEVTKKVIEDSKEGRLEGTNHHVYMHMATFVDMTEDDDEASPEADVELKKRKRFRKSHYSSSKSMSLKMLEDEMSSIRRTTYRPARIRLLNLGADTQVLEALLVEKDDVGDGGIITQVPTTRLDKPLIIKALGQFVSDFEDGYYYWQCYEITRRVMQTGAVMVVEMLSTRRENASLPFAVIVSVIALLLHVHCSPYNYDSLDQLQLIILVNQFIVQFALLVLHMQHSDEERDLAGIILVTLQVMLMTYGMRFMIVVGRMVLINLVSSLTDDADGSAQTVRRRLGWILRLSEAPSPHPQTGDDENSALYGMHSRISKELNRISGMMKGAFSRTTLFTANRCSDVDSNGMHTTINPAFNLAPSSVGQFSFVKRLSVQLEDTPEGDPSGSDALPALSDEKAT